jgi:hypothetical protein
VIARVLDEFDRPGAVINIDRIDLRLGMVSEQRLDTLVERLETALRDALAEALSTAAAWPVKDGRASAAPATDVAPVGAALLRSLTRYLLYGIWPYQHDTAGYPMALLANLIDHEPAALLQMVHRHRGHPEFVERLALQTAFADLERLLDLIEPEHAATILATMKRLRGAHRVAPSRGTSLVRRLWHLVLQSVMDVTGAGFDPVGFEQRLLQQISATQTSGDLTLWGNALTEEMATGSDTPRRIAPANLRTGPTAADAPMTRDVRREAEPAWLELLELVLLRGAWPGRSPDALLIKLAAEQPAALARLFRHHARNDAMLRRVTQILSPAALGQLLALLTPEAAATIVTYMLEVRELHSARPVLPLSNQSLQRLLWFVALRYVLNEAGSQFNRRSFVASLIEGIANAERLTYRELLDALYIGVAEVAKTAPVAASLPAIIIELARSLEPADLLNNPVSETERRAARGDGAPEARAVSLRTRPKEGKPTRERNRVDRERFTKAAASMAWESDPPGSGPWEPDRGMDRQTAADIAGLVADYGHLDRLRHLLATGVLPWRDILAEPQLTPQRLIEALERLRPGLVRTALKNAPLHRSDVRRALDAMPDAAVVSLIRLLLPRNAGDHELTQSVIAYSAGAADRRNFQAMLIIALVEGSALDFEALAAASDGPAGHVSANLVSNNLASALATETLLAALADGVGGGAETNTQWTETLLRLLESNVLAARRFMAAAAKSPAALTRMADLCGPTPLDRIFVVLAPAAAATLTAFARATIAESARHGLRRADIVAAFLAEIATIDADAGPSAGLILRLLRRLFGTTLPPWLSPVLQRDLLPYLSSGVATTLSVMLSAANVSKKPAFDLQPGEPAVARNDAASTEVPPPGQHAEWLFRALAESDLSRAVARDEVPELLHELMNELLETSNRELAVRLATFLSQARNNHHLIRLLPERQLAQLMMIAAPQAGWSLLEAGEVLAGAVGATGHAMDRSALWQALFDTAVAPIGERTVARLSERVLAIAGRASNHPDPAQKDAAAGSLMETLAQHARDAGLVALAAALEQQRDGLIAAYVDARRRVTVPTTTKAKRPPRDSRARAAFRIGAEDDDAPREPIYIGNAGLVLANPFLPHLFGALGLLDRNEAGKPRLRNEAAASRAVHLLQYLVDGSTDSPEPHLALNKVMCGMPIAAPVEREIEATDAERETCDMLLRSIVENWPILRNTSIAGLRETFLQREGKLTYGEAGWRLQVQRKTLDVLVDQVPWSIGIVFHAWMPGALHVTW